MLKLMFSSVSIMICLVFASIQLISYATFSHGSCFMIFMLTNKPAFMTLAFLSNLTLFTTSLFSTGINNFNASAIKFYSRAHSFLLRSFILTFSSPNQYSFPYNILTFILLFVFLYLQFHAFHIVFEVGNKRTYFRQKNMHISV